MAPAQTWCALVVARLNEGTLVCASYVPQFKQTVQEQVVHKIFSFL